MESESDTSDTGETENPNSDEQPGPSKPTTRSRTKAKEGTTQTDPHKGSQTERRPRKRPRSPREPRQLPLTGEPPQKMAAVSAERAEHIEDLIRALGQSQAATNSILGRIEKGQDLILTTLQDLIPRITILEARTQALQETRKEEFLQATAGPSRPLQPEVHTQTPHAKPPGGPGALGLF